MSAMRQSGRQDLHNGGNWTPEKLQIFPGAESIEENCRREADTWRADKRGARTQIEREEQIDDEDIAIPA